MSNKNHILNELFSATMSCQGMFFTLNILLEFKKAIIDPDTSVSTIATIIEKDPGLTASALKTANSSFYGFSKSITTVKQAISVLGYKTLEKILLAQTLKKTFVSSDNSIKIDLWKHSLTTAVAAQLISDLWNPILSEQLFISGLLHDLGKFILINYKAGYAENLSKILQKNPYQHSTALEEQLFGIDHAEIGEFFSKKWLFPESVTNTIKYHHKFDIDIVNREMVYTITLANNIAKAMEFGKSTTGLIELIPHKSYRLINFKKSDFEKIVYETKNRFFELTSLLED